MNVDEIASTEDRLEALRAQIVQQGNKLDELLALLRLLLDTRSRTTRRAFGFIVNS
jgi:hypothetical protein